MEGASPFAVLLRLSGHPLEVVLTGAIRTGAGLAWLNRLGKLRPSSHQAQLPRDSLGEGGKAIAEVLNQAMSTA